jgi:FMN phosphatase YigB (HAD superfamily)
VPPVVVFVLEDVLVPDQSLERWQWAWRPQGPVLPERTVRAALRRSLHAWDRRRWEGLTGAQPPADLVAYRQFLRSTLTEIAGRRLPDAETEAVVDRFVRAPIPRLPAADVLPALTSVRALGHRTVALAEFPGPATEELLRRAGLRGLIDHVAGTTPDAPAPPSREAFRAAVEGAGAKPAEAALVGRLYWSDVRAAQRAGLTGYLLDRNDWYSRVDERRLRSLSEFPRAVGASSSPSPTPAVPAG